MRRVLLTVLAAGVTMFAMTGMTPAEAQAGYFCAPHSPIFLSGGGPSSEGGYAMTNKEALDNAYAALTLCHWQGWNASPVRSRMGVWGRPGGLGGAFEAHLIGALSNGTTYGCSVNWRSAHGQSGYNVWCGR